MTDRVLQVVIPCSPWKLTVNLDIVSEDDRTIQCSLPVRDLNQTQNPQAACFWAAKDLLQEGSSYQLQWQRTLYQEPSEECHMGYLKEKRLWQKDNLRWLGFVFEIDSHQNGQDQEDL